MIVLRQHPTLCALGLRHDGVSTDIWDSMFWWSILTKYECCQRAGFHFMLVQLQNKILLLENLTYHLINTNTWRLSPFLKALNFWLCFLPHVWSHLKAPIHPHQGWGDILKAPSSSSSEARAFSYQALQWSRQELLSRAWCLHVQSSLWWEMQPGALTSFVSPLQQRQHNPCSSTGGIPRPNM